MTLSPAIVGMVKAIRIGIGAPPGFRYKQVCTHQRLTVFTSQHKTRKLDDVAFALGLRFHPAINKQKAMKMRSRLLWGLKE